MRRILEFSLREKLVGEGDHIVVALSGGVDSVVLLEVLLEISKKLDLKISAAHLNHSLRETSDRDEAFVRSLCRKFGVELHVDKVDVEEIRRERGGSIEEVAREVRYAFLRKVKRDIGASKIATAHHMDDLAETVIHRLIRGTGPKGLVAIRPLSGDLIRPLLVVTKREIEEYARGKGLDYVVDETNFDTRYTRNFIRHEIIPLLERLNPSVSRAIFRLSRTVKSMMDFLEPIVKESYVRSKRVLKDRLEFPADIGDFLVSEFVRMASEELTGGVPEWVKIESFLEGFSKTSHRVVFWENFGAWKSFDRFIVGRLFPLNVNSPVKLGELKLGEFVIRVEKGDAGDFSTYLNVGSLRFRGRREGDKIGGRKLKDVFIERRVPAYLRDEYPLLAYGERIIWVPGIYKDGEFQGRGLSFRILSTPLERR